MGSDQTMRFRPSGDVDHDALRSLPEVTSLEQRGAELVISAKTVEHHVARVRRKLGATSRAEMMAAIRDYLDRHHGLD